MGFKAIAPELPPPKCLNNRNAQNSTGGAAAISASSMPSSTVDEDEDHDAVPGDSPEVEESLKSLRDYYKKNRSEIDSSEKKRAINYQEDFGFGRFRPSSMRGYSFGGSLELIGDFVTTPSYNMSHYDHENIEGSLATLREHIPSDSPLFQKLQIIEDSLVEADIYLGTPKRAYDYPDKVEPTMPTYRTRR